MSTGNINRAICLEGNAGCGKTTAGRALADALNGIFLPEYTETLNDAQRRFLMLNFERNGDDDEYPLWECAERYRSERVLAEPHRVQIMDTSLLSVIGFDLVRRALSKGCNLNSLVSGYLRLLTRETTVLPGRIILLYSSEAEQLKRISIRGYCHPFLARHDVSALLAQIRADFLKKYVPSNGCATLDTTTLSLLESSDRITRLSRELRAYDLREAFRAWVVDVSRNLS